MKVLISIIFVFSISVSALEYKCPERIDTHQSLSNPPEGWGAIVDKMNGQQNFENMQVFDGNPEEGASLKPDYEGPKKIPTWTNNTVKGFWVACYYRQSTVRLTKEIPKSIKKCAFKYKIFPGAKNKITDTLICQ